MGEERRISAMYTAVDSQWHMFPMGDGGGEEDLSHVHSAGLSVTHVPNGGGEEDLSHVHSGGLSVTHIPNGGWGRRGGSQPLCSGGRSVTHDRSGRWGEDRTMSGMNTLGDPQWDISPVGDGIGEENLSFVCSGGCSVTHVPTVKYP